jgi:hypothetical protein
LGADDPTLEVAERRLDGDEVRRVVVDDEDVPADLRGFGDRLRSWAIRLLGHARPGVRSRAHAVIHLRKIRKTQTCEMLDAFEVPVTFETLLRESK